MRWRSLGLILLAAEAARAGDGMVVPKVADGWAIERLVEAPAIAYPTAIVVAPDGTAYLGQDPMDMPGPPTRPIDSVVAIKDGRVRVFAENLWAVMGLEWVDGTLFVVQAPFLSALKDTDGDGRADQRVDLVTGLGPALPGFNGINDHIASGIRLGMDGYLYIAVGDKGLPRAVGRDGRTVTMASGGVIRVRPDGTGLERVSTGERNPLSVALNAFDDVFTYGNDDDSKAWPNSLTHHIVGGHYGYPYEFLTAPHRALPIVTGQLGGAGAQGICYEEAGLPARFRGNLFFCDWGTREVLRFEVIRNGATYRMQRKEAIVERGGLTDFRPFSLAIEPGGASFLLVDWAYNGWLADGPPTGRLFRLRYVGGDRPQPVPAASGITGLDHPARSVRLEAQRALVQAGKLSVPALLARLGDRHHALGRIHALWALDAIGAPAGRQAIRAALKDSDSEIRQQAARSVGIRGDREAMVELIPLLVDADAPVRREAAIALGKLGDLAAAKPLYEALGDGDAFVAWSVRRAIRELGAWNADLITSALADPNRRENALKLVDESWSVAGVRALADAVGQGSDPGWRGRVVTALASNALRYPEWTGQWFGTNPLAGLAPKRTVAWDPAGMAAVLEGLTHALGDPDADVRLRAIVGLHGTGPSGVGVLLAALRRESDATNLATLARVAGQSGDASAVAPLASLLADATKPLPARLEALDALARFPTRPAVNARMRVAYDTQAPAALVARALPPLGQARLLPANDLAGFFDHADPVVRAAALRSLPVGRALPEEVVAAILPRLEDPAVEVRAAAAEAVASQKIVDAVPRLLTLANAEATRVEATRALAAIPDPRALPIYLAALRDRDPGPRKSAEQALLTLGDSVRGDLESLVKKGRLSGPAALAVERILARPRTVLDWRVIGPFPRAASPRFGELDAIDFAREQPGIDGRPLRWEVRKGDPATGRVVLDDFKAGQGDRGGFGFDSGNSPDLMAYAYAEIPSDRDGPALLLVGSSGSIVLVLNGKTVLNLNTAGRAFASDSDVVRVTLKQGVNRILVASRQGVGPWSFAVQVADASVAGPSPVETLRGFASSHAGDPKRGEELFFAAAGVGCAKCHAVGSRGDATVGPNLAGLASKYDKAEVIRSVLEPSSRIATGYQPVLIARQDGTILTGLIRGETETSVDLVDAQGKVVSILKTEIAERRLGETSLMPAGQADALTPVEFADLIAYLMSLSAR